MTIVTASTPSSPHPGPPTRPPSQVRSQATQCGPSPAPGSPGPSGQDKCQQLGSLRFSLHLFSGGAPQLGSPEGTFLCCQDKIHQSFPICSRPGLSQHHDHTGPDSDHRDRFCSVLLGNSQLLAARLKTQKPRSLLSLNQLFAPQV